MNRIELRRNGKPDFDDLGLCLDVASGFWSRLKGLLGRSDLAEDRGILIYPCNRVHTIGMKFSIDVIFLSKTGEILKIVSDLQPCKQAGSKGGYFVIELASGVAEQRNLKKGETLRW